MATATLNANAVLRTFVYTNEILRTTLKEALLVTFILQVSKQKT